jgi:hypothetical protein
MRRINQVLRNGDRPARGKLPVPEGITAAIRVPEDLDLSNETTKFILPEKQRHVTGLAVNNSYSLYVTQKVVGLIRISGATIETEYDHHIQNPH